MCLDFFSLSSIIQVQNQYINKGLDGDLKKWKIKGIWKKNKAECTAIQLRTS